MNKRKSTTSADVMYNNRLLSEEQARSYLNLGRNSVRKFCSKINAQVHVGRRVCYDKTAIDAYLDNRAKLNETNAV